MRQNALLSRCSHFFNLAGPVCLATILTAAVLAPAAQAQTTYRWVDKEGHVHYGDKAPMPAEVKDLQLKKLKGGKSDQLASTWLAAAELTATRAAFLLVGDLEQTARFVAAEPETIFSVVLPS